MININFELFITLGTIITGIMTLLNWLFWKKRRALKKTKEPVIIEYVRGLFPIFLIVLLIRSFVGQLYRVPTGSLEPTVMPGDLVAVTQFSYGLHLPVLHTVNRAAQIIPIGNPQRGEIALFYWPLHPGTILIKRVVGLPGDHLVYRHKQLTINGVLCQQKVIGKTQDVFDTPHPRDVNIVEENLLGKKHLIYLQPYGGETKDYDIRVPAGDYFMMGDNRDDSWDSRGWGFAPRSSFIGKAQIVVFSWNPLNYHVRWHRIGTRL